MASRRALRAAQKAGSSLNAALLLNGRSAASQNGSSLVRSSGSSVLREESSLARGLVTSAQVQASSCHLASATTLEASQIRSQGARGSVLFAGVGPTGELSLSSSRHLSAAAALPSHQDIAMPSLSPTMTQGNIAKWVKQAGDEVAAGDVLCEIETDKATLSMESMEDGFLAKILISEGTKDIPVGTPIAVMVDSAEDMAAFKDYSPGGGEEAPAAPSPSPAASSAGPPPADLPPFQPVAMPSLSPTMTQGNIAKWMKQVGDSVASGDVLCDIETDKATLSMESMEDGFVAKILIAEGTKDIPVGTPIAIMVEEESYIAKFASIDASALGGGGGGAAPQAPPSPAAASGPAPSDLPKHQAVAMPSLSPTMTQGNINKWRKAVGDKVAAGDVLCEIETDKATLEMESMEDGVVAKILFLDGAKDVPVGTPIVILAEDKADIPKFQNYSPAAAPSTSAAPPPTPAAASPPPTPAPSAATSPPAITRAPGGRVLATPAAKKLAQDKGADISLISGTGPGGRVIRADVEDFLKAPRPAAPSVGVAAAPAPSLAPSEVRKAVASRMVESVQTIPHYYLSVDTRVSNIEGVLAGLNALQGKTKGTPITLEHLIIKAAATAAKRVPACNSSWAGDTIQQYDRVDISLNVYTDYGLVNPVIRDADSKGLAAIASEVERLKEAARLNQLSPADLQGGTFSVASVAEYGLKSCNSIINPPQACILTIGSVQSRVVLGSKPTEFANEAFVTANLSCDHRVVDGAVGAELLGVFKSIVEDPLALIL